MKCDYPNCEAGSAGTYCRASCVQLTSDRAAAVDQTYSLGCDHCKHPLYAAVKCRVCGRKTPIIEPEIKNDNKPDVADDLALIVRNAIASINRLERQINELKRAAPPQRKPLTEEEIDSIWDSEKAFADIYAIARAIERAHGIGGQP